MPARTTNGVIAEFMDRQTLVRFFLDDPEDIIQGCHARGEFYEGPELALIERYMPAGGAYLDVGANVGNHLIYVAKFCRPAEIIAVEPNVRALKFLEINLALNRVDAAVVPLGLSDGPGRAEARWPNHNLGGARLFEEAGGSVRLVAGDDLFSARKIDFIKIDVETQELRVLKGLQRTIQANRPALLVEVDDQNRDAMAQWVEAQAYRVETTHRHYVDNENLLLLPL